MKKHVMTVHEKAAVGWLGLCLLATGCATAPSQAPALVLAASLDREAYQIGQPLIATVSLKNEGPDPVDVPRFDHQALTFFYREQGSSAPIEREPVFSRATLPEPRELGPGETRARRFLLTRLTGAEGDYVFLAGFKGAISGGALFAQEIYCPGVPYRVTQPVALERDPANGLILKAQARELAERWAPGEAAAVRVVLKPLDDTGLYTWVVFLRVAPSDGPEYQDAVRVNPYTGKVSTLELNEEPHEGSLEGK